ncbi:hypothetical protein BJ878DRAFT_430506 [Calycina marina]|uniref:Uncharacterized protein n=1 Tax=Calycina marina TaxID=1763456 RepID=A0A9P7YWF3_9HELO|nr:hypothetical protein BJ878DRAFT_430506 [Calycina marina]
MMSSQQSDTPLSITSSVASITFVVAIAAPLYARWTYLRNAESEYFQFRTSLSYYRTENTWMRDLIHSSDGTRFRREGTNTVSFIKLLKMLEDRLLEVVAEAEEKFPQRDLEKWSVVTTFYKFGERMAMSWLPVRAKALELVRQRYALGSRVFFAHMIMTASWVMTRHTLALLTLTGA